MGNNAKRKFRTEYWQAFLAFAANAEVGAIAESAMPPCSAWSDTAFCDTMVALCDRLAQSAVYELDSDAFAVPPAEQSKP